MPAKRYAETAGILYFIEGKVKGVAVKVIQATIKWNCGTGH